MSTPSSRSMNPLEALLEMVSSDLNAFSQASCSANRLKSSMASLTSVVCKGKVNDETGFSRPVATTPAAGATATTN